jgi:DNA-binding transcriptional ArsR family regulator
MHGDADIAALGALIGDRSRARVLLALGDGRALAASVLAVEAGVSASTASEHLSKLVDAGLLKVEAHGRHRYYRLAGPQVGRLIEVLAENAPPAPVRSLREGTRAHEVREARYCYDHLAGRLGVAIMGSLIDRGLLAGGDGDRTAADCLSAYGHDVDYRLTDDGAGWVRGFGVDLDALAGRSRPMIRYCTDWSEQRHHLAGALGAGIAERLVALRWIVRAPKGRAVRVTPAGREGLAEAFGVRLDAADTRARISA